MKRQNRFRLIIAIATCGLLTNGCQSSPQVIPDAECFRAVDALWTAVTTRRKDLLEQTAIEFDRLKSEGKLADAGHRSLTAIVDQSRRGDWREAAITLKRLIRSQRKPNTA